VAGQSCGAHELIGLTGEQQKVVDDGGARGGRRWCGELACPALMAGGSSSNPVPEKEATTTSFSPRLGWHRGSA
jgi:hypothetical protein